MIKRRIRAWLGIDAIERNAEWRAGEIEGLHEMFKWLKGTIVDYQQTQVFLADEIKKTAKTASGDFEFLRSKTHEELVKMAQDFDGGFRSCKASLERAMEGLEKIRVLSEQTSAGFAAFEERLEAVEKFKDQVSAWPRWNEWLKVWGCKK